MLHCATNALDDRVAVKELNLDYHIGETLLISIILITAIEVKFLNSNPDEALSWTSLRRPGMQRRAGEGEARIWVPVSRDPGLRPSE